MITTMNSGAEYGLALIWVFTVGIVLKFVLSEAVSRLQMSGDRSLISHLTRFGGRTFPVLFLIAELLVGLFFGAGVVAVTTNILQAIFRCFRSGRRPSSCCSRPRCWWASAATVSSKRR